MLIKQWLRQLFFPQCEAETISFGSEFEVWRAFKEAGILHLHKKSYKTTGIKYEEKKGKKDEAREQKIDLLKPGDN